MAARVAKLMTKPTQRAKAPRLGKGKASEPKAAPTVETDEERLDRLLAGINARAPTITAQINALLVRVGLAPMS